MIKKIQLLFLGIVAFGLLFIGLTYGYTQYKETKPCREIKTEEIERIDGFIESYERNEKAWLPINQSATCTFNRINYVSFEFRENNEEAGRVPYSKTEEAKIYFDSSLEAKPNTSTFVDLDTENPKMAGNMGQDELIKAYEDEKILHMITKDSLSFGNLITYTIFKNEGLAIWAKSYDMLGVPFGMMSIGYCQ
jgi:hypothetical protein